METGLVYKMREILTMRRVSGRWSPKCGSLPRDEGDLAGLPTYDTTSSLRPASQVRYDLFTNMVAKRYRIVRTIRLFTGRISTIVYISIFPAFDELGRGRNKYVLSKHGKVQSKICLNSSNVYLDEKKCLYRQNRLVSFS